MGLTQSKIEETLNRINTHKGVKGIIILSNSKGIPIKSTMSPKDTTEYSSLLHTFISQTQIGIQNRFKVSTPQLQEEVEFIRIRSKKHEIMVAPDKEYSLIVLQLPGHGET